jgi:FecR protein
MKAVSFAGKWLALLLLAAWVQLAWAAGEAAVVVSVVGTVSSQMPDGKIRVLAKDAVLMSGEIVLTEKGSSARLRFSDNSMVTLRAASRLLIENFSYDEAQPASDSLVLNLVKGGMRAVSGSIGKRGNQDAYQARTRAGTIGIRGTDYAVMQCVEQDDSCRGLDIPPEFRDSHDTLPTGLYLTVFEGAINFSNKAGSKDFSEGKSGYVRDDLTLPRELSDDPGLAREFPTLGNLPGTLNPFGGSASACLVR